MTILSDNKFLTPKWIALFLFLIALFLRVAYVFTLEIHYPIRADAANYAKISYNLLTHGVYTHVIEDNPKANSLAPPGFPFLITAISYFTGNIKLTYNIILLLNAVMGAVSVLLCFLIAIRFLPKWAAVTTGILTTFSPHLVVASGYMLTETPFAFFLILSIYSLVIAIDSPNKKLFFLFGLIAGLTALIRPTALPVVIFALIPFTIKSGINRKTLKLTAFSLLGLAITWGPWQIWATINPPPVTNAGSVFAFGTYPDFTFKDPALRGYPNKDDPEFGNMARSYGHTLNILFERTKENPFKYIKWYVFDKPTIYWSWSTVQGAGGPYVYPVEKSIYDKAFLAFLSFRIMENAHILFVSILFIGLTFTAYAAVTKKLWSQYDLTILTVLGVIIGTTLFHTVFSVLPRYSVPFHFYLYIANLFFINLAFTAVKHNDFQNRVTRLFQFFNQRTT